ncbi:MAG: hypothetical protein AAFV95_09320 [Bacteroidota bacterium]
MKNQQIVLFLLLTSFVACDWVEKKIVIDNPSSRSVRIAIDDKNIELAAGESKKVMVRFGKQSVQVDNGPSEEIYLDSEHDYLLNPTRATYYVEDVMFFRSRKAEKEYNRYNKGSIVEGYQVPGKFEKIEGQLLLKKNWRFGIGERASSEMYIDSPLQRQSYSFRKLHRAAKLRQQYSDDLLKALREGMTNKRMETAESPK